MWVFATVIAAGSGAAAQTADLSTPPRADGRVRGGEELAAPGLHLSVTTAAGHDSNLLAAQQGGAGNSATLGQQGFSGEFGEAAGTLTYLRQRDQTSFHVGASSNGRYYPQMESPIAHSHFVETGLRFQIGRRWGVALRQAGQYASFYHLAPVATATGPIAPSTLVVVPTATSPETTALSQASFGYDSNVELTQTIGQRNTLRYHYLRRMNDTGIVGRRMTSWGSGGLYRRSMSRYLGLRLGYSYVEAGYDRQLAGSTRIHNLDTGFDYSRPLSFSRRTTVGFTGGTQVFERDRLRFYRFQGASQLLHEFGRTWSLAFGYTRGAQLVDVLEAPAYTDAVTAHTGGYVGSRLRIVANASYSNGQLSFNATPNDMVTYSAGTQFDFALAERWSLFGAYGYYAYEFGPQVSLPAALLREVGRHSVRGGLTLRMPLLAQRGFRGPR